MSVPDPTKRRPYIRLTYTKHLAFMAVGVLGVMALASLGSGVHLTALTIRLNPKDAALAAVYQSEVDRILGLANICVVAISALLASTDRSQQIASDTDPPKEQQ